ncbi:hypothetical protein GQA12_28460 [Paenibacillus alvei]|nr:hypothetical protein [Paenibacillus alvei]
MRKFTVYTLLQYWAQAAFEQWDISHRTSDEAELMATGTLEQLVSAEKIQISAEELRDMSQQLQNDLSKFVLCNDV